MNLCSLFGFRLCFFTLYTNVLDLSITHALTNFTTISSVEWVKVNCVFANNGKYVYR